MFGLWFDAVKEVEDRLKVLIFPFIHVICFNLLLLKLLNYISSVQIWLKRYIEFLFFYLLPIYTLQPCILLNLVDIAHPFTWVLLK